jgi:iron complex transport system substrate-binding protein
MKRILSLVLLFALFMTLLLNCTPSKKTSTGPEESRTAVEAAAAYPRTYTDILGREVVLEKKPEKIALLFFHHYEYLLALDEPPAFGTDVSSVYESWATLAPYSKSYPVVDMGDLFTPNIEKLLEAAPDLILVYDGLYKEHGPVLEKIAPTIAIGRTAGTNWGTWEGVLTEYGKIFAKEDKAEAVIADLKASISARKALLSDLRNKTFTFLLPTQKGFSGWAPEYVYGPENSLGLDAPAGYLDGVTALFSIEAVAAMNPDYIMIYDDMTTTVTEDQLRELENNTVWKSLSAVKNGHVYIIDRSTFSGGPLGMALGSEFLAQTLKGVSSGLNAAAFPRVHKDGTGTEVRIEKAPERVAVLHYGYSEYLLALGIEPAASTLVGMIQQFETLKRYIGTKHITDIGDVLTPNLEKLLEIQPDLIIGGVSMHENMRDNLSKIAPTVIMGNYTAWRSTLSNYADIFGKEAEAAQYIKDTEGIIRTTREKIAPLADKKVVFLRPASENTFAAIGKGGIFAYYHDRRDGFGLAVPDAYPDARAVMSLEAVAALSPDIIFFQDTREKCEKLVAEVSASKVWQSIPAVKNGQTYYLDISLNTGSPLAIRLAAEQITSALGVR